MIKDIGEVIIQNSEPYKSIYNFINSHIIPKYDCLTSCYQSNFDEEGTPKVQYFIRYETDLSIDQWHSLRSKIRKDIKEFCFSSGISYHEYLEIDFIVTVDGDYSEKYGNGF